MTNPISIAPGSKRSLDDIGSARRQRLNSSEGSQESKACPTLSSDLWHEIALKLSRSDLKNLSNVSRNHQITALRALNKHELEIANQELKALTRLNPGKPQTCKSMVNFYQDSLYRLRSQALLTEENWRLQQSLVASTTNHVAEKLLSLFHDSYDQIVKEKTSFEEIEQKYLSIKTTLIIQGLQDVLAKAINPESERCFVFIKAATEGHLEIVKAFLQDRLISEEERGPAVWFAASEGHLEIVKTLLAYGSIGQIDRGSAVWLASAQGYLEIVKILLASGCIHNTIRGDAVYEAAKGGHLEIVKILLASGLIEDRERQLALDKAVEKGHQEIADCLKSTVG